VRRTGREDLDIRRIDTSQLVPRFYPGFQRTWLMDVLDKLAWGHPLILKGPKGAGKTLSLEQWAAEKNVPLLRKSCTGDTGDRHLLGGYVLKSLDESFFNLGVLATAVDVANEVGYCLLALEEINALNEEAQKTVNSIADYRREVDVQHAGRVFRLLDPVVLKDGGTVWGVEEDPASEHRSLVTVGSLDGEGEPQEFTIPTRLLKKEVAEGYAVGEGDAISEQAKLWVVGTMNPGYGGTYDLNEDFRSRFQFIEVFFMPEETEAEILYSKFPGRLSSAEKVFVARLQSLAKETRTGKYGYALSTRDLEQAIAAYLAFADVGKALKMIEGKFDGEQRVKDFQARVRSAFKQPIIDLTAVSLA